MMKLMNDVEVILTRTVLCYIFQLTILKSFHHHHHVIHTYIQVEQIIEAELYITSLLNLHQFFAFCSYFLSPVLFNKHDLSLHVCTMYEYTQCV